MSQVTEYRSGCRNSLDLAATVTRKEHMRMSGTHCGALQSSFLRVLRST